MKQHKTIPPKTLQAILATALAALLAAAIAAGEPSISPVSLSSDQPQVWDVYSEYVVRGRRIHRPTLQAILDTGLQSVTGAADPNHAWRRLLEPEDVVALKFNPVAADVIATNSELAILLVESLERAGWPRDRILVAGLAQLPSELASTRSCPYGWQDELLDFASDRDHLALWLADATAVINVATVLDDNVIGLRGALANMTLGTVKRPARLYVNGADPFLSDIYAHPAIRGKVRLHILNALRILAHDGHPAQERYVYDYGALLLGHDPVALDVVAVHLLHRARRFITVPDEADRPMIAPYLQTAQALGLGECDLNRIVYHRCRHGGL